MREHHLTCSPTARANIFDKAGRHVGYKAPIGRAAPVPHRQGLRGSV